MKSIMKMEVNLKSNHNKTRSNPDSKSNADEDDETKPKERQSLLYSIFEFIVVWQEYTIGLAFVQIVIDVVELDLNEDVKGFGELISVVVWWVAKLVDDFCDLCFEFGIRKLEWKFEDDKDMEDGKAEDGNMLIAIDLKKLIGLVQTVLQCLVLFIMTLSTTYYLFFVEEVVYEDGAKEHNDEVNVEEENREEVEH
ncbi:unnamed protein product [Ambrosiozyma monospora]|uniref:Unnamed protein product n=2 Tax=Ambrosiozyma monospora TaxID=43982 RepID=A0ACB5U505_AMBMO|nr:unnamed protein product [Ambrosiozyma monospora]